MKFLKKIIFGLLFMAAVTISFQQEARASIDGLSVSSASFDPKGSSSPTCLVSLTAPGTTPESNVTYHLYAYAGSKDNNIFVKDYTYNISENCWYIGTVKVSKASESVWTSFERTDFDSMLESYLNTLDTKSAANIPLGFYFQEDTSTETSRTITAAIVQTPESSSNIDDVTFTVSPAAGTLIYAGDTVTYTVATPTTILTGDHINADRTSSTYKYWDASNVSGTPTTSEITVTCPSDTAFSTPKYYYNYDNVTGVTVSSSPTIDSYSGYDGILVTGTQYTLTPAVSSTSSSWTAGEAAITSNSSGITVSQSGNSYSFTVPASYSGNTVSLSVTVTDGTYTKGTGTGSFTKTLTYYVRSAGIDADDQIVISEGATISLSNFVTVYPASTSLGYKFSPTGYASASGTTISKASLTGNSSGQTTLTVYDSDDETIKDSGTVKVYPKSSVSISSGTAELSVPTAANTGSSSTYITKTTGMLISADTGSKTYYYNGSEWTTSRTAYSVSSSSGYSVSTTLSSSTMKALGSKIKSDGISTSSVTLSVAPYGNTASGTDNYNNDVSASKTIYVYKITLDSSSGAGYTVDGSTTSDYFYAINGLTYTVDSYAKNSGYKFSKWDGGESSSATISSFSPSSSRTLKAVYESSTVAGSSATGSSSLNSSGSLSGYDKVPKTGESWSDILILCGILLASVTGAAVIICKQISLKKAFARKSESLQIPDGENKGGTK